MLGFNPLKICPIPKSHNNLTQTLFHAVPEKPKLKIKGFGQYLKPQCLDFQRNKDLWYRFRILNLFFQYITFDI